jgi:uncharacterized membrane protein YbhN (UPF0104 family)
MQTYFKLLCSVVLLGVLVTQVDWHRLIELCYQAHYMWLGVGLFCFLLLIIPHLLRWQIILKYLHIRCSYSKLSSLLWIGYFFNQIMPTSIGGDAARLWYLQKEGHAWKTVFHSLVLDRGYALVGLCALYVVLYLSLLFYVFPLVYQSAFYVCICVLAFFGLLIFSARSHWVEFCLGSPLLRWILPVWRDWQCVASLKVTLPLVSLSIINHVLNGFAFVAVSKAFHLPLALGALFLIFPVMLLTSMLPFSFAGWGVREGVLVWLLSQYGVAAEQAFAVSILYGVLQLGVGLVGGIVWFRSEMTAFWPNRLVNYHG